MIIDKLYIPGIFALPSETYPVLIVHPDAVLSFTVTAQLFQAISRRVPEVFERSREVNRFNLSGCGSGDASEFPALTGQI